MLVDIPFVEHPLMYIFICDLYSFCMFVFDGIKLFQNIFLYIFFFHVEILFD